MSSPRLLASILLPVFVIAALTLTARAQVISSPIPWNELCTGIRERGAPPDLTGWNTVRKAYRSYLDECNALRAGRDAAWFSDSPPVNMWSLSEESRNDMRMLDRKAAQQLQLDQTLMDAAVEAGGAAGASRATFLHTWCERRFLLSQRFLDRSGTRYVPGQMRRARWMSEADRALVASAMDALELRMVSLERKRHAAVAPAVRAVAEARASLPPRPAEDWESEASQQWFRQRDFATRWAVRPLRVIEGTIDRTVDEAVAALIPSLSPASQRVAYAVMEARFNGELDPGDPRYELQRVQCWLATRDVSDDVLQAMRTLVSDWRDEDDRLQAAWQRAARHWAGARNEDYDQPLADGTLRQDSRALEAFEVSNRRRRATESLVMTVHTTLLAAGMKELESTEELVRRVRREGDPLFAGLRAPDGDEEGWGDEWDHSATDEASDEGETQSSSFLRDQWVEMPSSDTAVEAFLQRSDADAALRAIIESIYGDFIERWKIEIEPVRAAAANIQMQDANGMLQLSAAAAIAAAGREIRDAARSAERDFFDAIAAVVPVSDQDALNVWRVSETLGTPEWNLEHRELQRDEEPLESRHPVSARHGNLAMAVQLATLSSDDRAIAERIIAANALALINAGHAIEEAECQHMAVSTEGGIREWLANQHPEVSDAAATAAAEAKQQRRNAFRQVSAAASAVEALNVDLWRSFEAGLSHEGAVAVRRQHQRLLIPSLQSEATQPQRMSLRVLDLLAEDPERVAFAAELLEEWTQRFETLTDEIAELGPEPLPDGNGVVMSSERHAQHRDWLHFYRQQETAMLLHGWALLVTEEERASLPRLPLR